MIRYVKDLGWTVNENSTVRAATELEVTMVKLLEDCSMELSATAGLLEMFSEDIECVGSIDDCEHCQLMICSKTLYELVDGVEGVMGE
jgi:hypothetical protein